MPKAMLTFDLPAEREEFGRAANAERYCSALWGFAEYLRNQERRTEPADRDDIVAVRERFYAELDAAGVTLE